MEYLFRGSLADAHGELPVVKAAIFYCGYLVVMVRSKRPTLVTPHKASSCVVWKQRGTSQAAPSRKVSTAVERRRTGGQTIGGIGVYLVDDNRLVRESLCHVFQSTKDIRVVGEAPMTALAMSDIARSSPEVLLLQCELSASGRSCLQPIKQRFPRLKIMMCGMSASEEEFFTAIRCGATGYLLRDSSIEEIVEAVRSLHRNEGVVPRTLSLALVEFAAGFRTQNSLPASGNAFGLTRREHQLVPLIRVGCTNKQIAERLGISEQTVKNHMRSMLRKLKVKHRFEISEQLARRPLHAIERRYELKKMELQRAKGEVASRFRREENPVLT